MRGAAGLLSRRLTEIIHVLCCVFFILLGPTSGIMDNTEILSVITVFFPHLELCMWNLRLVYSPKEGTVCSYISSNLGVLGRVSTAVIKAMTKAT